MTITYTGSVANARLFGFSRLLFYWKGSIYKLMYKEMIVFCCIYLTLSLTYRFALNEPQKVTFEKVALYCDAFTSLIPLSFVLGFYVAICVGRWWNQYICIPWPDRCMMCVTTMIDGADERGRLLRRTIMRYLSLSSLIVFQATSVVVKKRFPTMDHLMDAGLITASEVIAMNEVQTPHGKWWVPFVWTCNLIKAARKEGRIADTFLMKNLIDEVQKYRTNLGMLFSYDWISVPLVYTQVTTLAVYSFFLSCVFGRQFLDPTKHYIGHEVDLYIPFFTLLQFFFYMGWLKVAEQMINPFGEDDDDFEMNWVIDRNLQVSLIVVDDMYDSYPPLEKDAYFDESAPDSLPYTKSTVDTIIQPHMGSTADLSVSSEGMKVVTPMETIQENEGNSTQVNPPHHSNHTNHTSLYPNYYNTPGTSPANNRRLCPNIMMGNHPASGMHTPYNASKNTLDGTKNIFEAAHNDRKPEGNHSNGNKPLHLGSSSKYSSLACLSGRLQSQLDGLLTDVSVEHPPISSHLSTSIDSSLSPVLNLRKSIAENTHSPAVRLRSPSPTPGPGPRLVLPSHAKSETTNKWEHLAATHGDNKPKPNRYDVATHGDKPKPHHYDVPPHSDNKPKPNHYDVPPHSDNKPKPNHYDVTPHIDNKPKPNHCNVFVIDGESKEGKENKSLDNDESLKSHPTYSDLSSTTAPASTLPLLPTLPPLNSQSNKDKESPENRFEVTAVEDEGSMTSAAENRALRLGTIIEAERTRHSSEEHSGDYVTSANSSVNSFTPLLKHDKKGKKDENC